TEIVFFISDHSFLVLLISLLLMLSVYWIAIIKDNLSLFSPIQPTPLLSASWLIYASATWRITKSPGSQQSIHPPAGRTEARNFLCLLHQQMQKRGAAPQSIKKAGAT
nr:hypothetical protein [Anaerolineae bacterium]